MRRFNQTIHRQWRRYPAAARALLVFDDHHPRLRAQMHPQAREHTHRIFSEVQYISEESAVEVAVRKMQIAHITLDHIDARRRDVAADATQRAEGSVVMIQRDETSLLSYQCRERAGECAFTRSEVGPRLTCGIADAGANEVGGFAD